ncbi:response regulator transcription factor, partial [Enteroscipio rubneri]
WLLVATLSLMFWSYQRYTAKQRLVGVEDAPEEPTAPLRLTPDDALEQLKETFGLSTREYEMIEEFAAGRSARHIADTFTLSEHTVKTHLRHAYAKMDVHSRQELLDLIQEMGTAKRS